MPRGKKKGEINIFYLLSSVVQWPELVSRDNVKIKGCSHE